MEDGNNLQLNDQIESNNEDNKIPCKINHSKGQQGEIEEKRHSSKYN